MKVLIFVNKFLKKGTARQPEATSDIRTTMIIAAALIEGVALFGEVICVLLALK